MCIDFTYLNKACPKDCYLLPSINQKLEAVVEHEVLNFLDLYKGSHQVLMDANDTPKIAFTADREYSPTRRYPSI